MKVLRFVFAALLPVAAVLGCNQPEQSERPRIDHSAGERREAEGHLSTAMATVPRVQPIGAVCSAAP